MDTLERPEQGTTEKSAANFSLVLHSIAIPIQTFKTFDIDKVEVVTLHKPCHTRAKREFGDPRCQVCRAVVGKDTEEKAVEVNGRYVVVTEEELDGCNIMDDKVIMITEFVDADKFDPIYFESHLYVAPNKGGEVAFAILRDAMRKSGAVAMATVRKGGRQCAAILKPYEHGMVLHYLYYDYEVRKFTKGANGICPSQEDVDLMASIISNMYAKRDTFRRKFDRYAENIRDLVNSKLAARKRSKTEKMVYDKEMTTTVDVNTVLKETLAKVAKAGE